LLLLYNAAGARFENRPTVLTAGLPAVGLHHIARRAAEERLLRSLSAEPSGLSTERRSRTDRTEGLQLWLQQWIRLLRIRLLLMRHELNEVLNQLHLLWHELRELLKMLLLGIFNVQQLL